MPRKNRRNKGDGTSGAVPSSIDDVEYLSESHTIVTLNSVATNNTDGSLTDDADWQLGQDDVDDDPNGGMDGGFAAETRHQKLLDSLALLDEFSTEKRSAKREAMLKQWFKSLTQHATSPASSEAVYNRRDDIIHACKSALMRGSPSEQYAACRVLEAAVVLVGDESYYEQIQGLVKKMIQGTHRAVPVRSAALRVLGMAVFVGVDDDVITEQILDLCEELAQPQYRSLDNPKPLRATALDVWTLLSTTIHELYVAGKDDVSIGRGLLLLPLLLQCLEQSEDLSLRSAAGECIAWIHTARLALGVDDEEGENITERKYAQGSWEGSEWEDVMTEIEMRMNELSNQSGHHMSKKAKKEQRATFREYLATVQDNEPPNEVVQFRGGSLEFDDWRDVIALNFIRRCLQGGFQIHLMTNPTLQAIFGANGSTLNANGGYSQLEKRLILSKTSEVNKLKDIDRTKKRRNRTNVKNHFLTVDGDGI